MAGHSHWKQIKEHKGAADQKRAATFSKLLRLISAAAVHDPNPQFNPRLRAVILKAKEYNVPQDNIERAIKKAAAEKNLEEIIMEAYGPGGSAMLIKAVTNNSNRTVNETKTILKNYGAKWAEPGSVRWAFEQIQATGDWAAKFKQNVSYEDKTKLNEIVETLENHEDIERVYTNT